MNNTLNYYPSIGNLDISYCGSDKFTNTPYHKFCLHSNQPNVCAQPNQTIDVNVINNNSFVYKKL